MNFYNPTGWLHGSPAELKEEISHACFLEQLEELQQGPEEVIEGTGMRGYLSQIWPHSGLFPNISCRAAHSELSPAAWPFSKSLAHIRKT